MFQSTQLENALIYNNFMRCDSKNSCNCFYLGTWYPGQSESMFYGHSHSYLTQPLCSLISLEVCLIITWVSQSISCLSYMMRVFGSLCKKTRKVFMNILKRLHSTWANWEKQRSGSISKGSEIVYERLLVRVFSVPST